MYRYIKDSYFYKKFFWIGIFLIPSAPSIGCVFLLISSIFSLKNNFGKLFDDKWNCVFIFSGFLMPIICLIQSDNESPLYGNWDKSLTWIGLTNWVLLIFCFLSFQFFVSTREDRRLFAKLLIAGTFPVLISGFSQIFLKVYGPFEILNGLITWFQRPLSPDSGMTALFNNQNYAGAWFCIIWPLSLAALLDSFRNKVDKYIALSFLISITVAIILTTSRSAWGGLILLIPLMSGLNSITFLLPIIFLALVVIFLTTSNFVPIDFQNHFREIIPNRLWHEFIPENFQFRESRLEIWKVAVNYINQRPLIGWGAGVFSFLYFYEKNTYAGHSHNLILELAVSYGIPVTILIFGSIFNISISSFSKIFRKNSYSKIDFFERAWYSSFLVLFCSQLVDIQYFDVRISLVFWILLAGLKEIIKNSFSQKLI